MTRGTRTPGTVTTHVLQDPRDDPDVAGYVGRYLAVLSKEPGGWATWYAQRIGGTLGPAAQRAAGQTVPHADTPTQAWLDTLGRNFLNVAHNRVPGGDGRLADQYCRTLSLLDIQGNAHEVRDALGRAVMRYGYTMTSAQVTQAGMDNGEGLLLPDVTGRPVYSRNSRGFTFRTDYDPLRRPVRTYVTGPGITGQALQTLIEYGERLPDAEARNLRTRVASQYDGGGVATSEAYDFKGNLLGTKRQFAAVYHDVIDWASQVPLEERDYRSRTSYDALNRPTSMTTPDRSVISPSYNQASQLDRIDGRLREADQNTTFVGHIDYNARNQRTLISYGNGSVCEYSYDPLTFRLFSLTTLRGAQRLQDLRYTYDPVGNPTFIRDHAQQRIFFRNHVVDPSASYTYDALYRLIEATGREHLGQAAQPVPPGATDEGHVGLPQPGDGAAMAHYAEQYLYDEVGNLLRMAHRSADPAHDGWTRDYRYREPSLLEPARHSNRLTAVGPARAVTHPHRFSYDEQGNTTSMPAILVLRWDEYDRLHATARAGQETTYYMYDAAGQRVRKVTERAAADVASRKHERIYVGPFEVYREYDADGTVTLERETLGVFDDKHRVALVETRTAGADPGPAELVRYQLANNLGSSVLELDQQAQVISYEEYYPYGSTSYQAVRSRTETPKRYRYTGQERDTETGLYYHGARYYAPWLGRWTSCDPAGLAKSPNLYEYVSGRPLVLVDKFGLAGSHWIDIPLLDEWAQGLDEKLNAEARARTSETPQGNVNIPLAIAKEAVQSANDLQGNPELGAIQSANTFQNEFAEAVLTPNANQATGHAVKAVAAAMKFTVQVITSLDMGPKSDSPGGSVIPKPMGAGPKTPSDTPAPTTPAAPTPTTPAAPTPTTPAAPPPTTPATPPPTTPAAPQGTPSPANPPQAPKSPEPIGGAPKPNVGTQPPPGGPRSPAGDTTRVPSEDLEGPNRGHEKSDSMEKAVQRATKNRDSLNDPDFELKKRPKQQNIFSRGKDKQDLRKDLFNKSRKDNK